MKRHLLVLSFLFILSFEGLAQPVIDSLKSFLEKAKPDSSKVDAYDELAWQTYLNGDWNGSLKYSNEGMLLANKLNYEKGKASLYHMIGNAYYSLSDYTKALENYLPCL